MFPHVFGRRRTGLEIDLPIARGGFRAKNLQKKNEEFLFLAGDALVSRSTCRSLPSDSERITKKNEECTSKAPGPIFCFCVSRMSTVGDGLVSRPTCRSLASGSERKICKKKNEECTSKARPAEPVPFFVFCIVYFYFYFLFFVSRTLRSTTHWSRARRNANDLRSTMCRSLTSGSERKI